MPSTWRWLSMATILPLLLLQAPLCSCLLHIREANDTTADLATLENWDRIRPIDPYSVPWAALVPMQFRASATAAAEGCDLAPLPDQEDLQPSDVVIVRYVEALQVGCLSRDRIASLLKSLEVALVIMVGTTDGDRAVDLDIRATCALTFLPLTAGTDLFNRARAEAVEVNATNGDSPSTAVYSSAGYMAMDGILIVCNVAIIVFAAYSLAHFIKKNGPKPNARSLVFIFAICFSLLKIPAFICDLLIAYDSYSIFTYTGSCFAFFSFMALLFAWLSVSQSVIRNVSSWKWKLLRGSLLTLPILTAVVSITVGLVEGPLRNKYFFYDTLSYYMKAAVLIPCLVISSIVMILAAVRVLFALRTTAQLSQNSILKRKIGITVTIDAIGQLFLVGFVIGQAEMGENSVLYACFIGLLEFVQLLVMAINLYCVSFQLKELVGTSSGKRSKSTENTVGLSGKRPSSSGEGKGTVKEGEA